MGSPIMKFCLWAVLLYGTGVLIGFQGAAGQVIGDRNVVIGAGLRRREVQDVGILIDLEGPPRPGRTLTTTRGTVFVSVFCTRAIEGEIPSWEIVIDWPDSLSPSVSMTNSISDLNKKATIGKREIPTFEIPNPQQIIGSETCSSGTIITAADDTFMMSSDFVGSSGDIILHYPVDQWGTEHHVITPTDEPSNSYAKFIVIADNILTRLTMVLGGAVQYKGHDYNKGDTLIVDLEPLQVWQLQSPYDLSGTMVKSQYPVAVQSGHSCVSVIEGCSDVYEQLLPVEYWGRDFYVSAPSFSSGDSQVHVLSSKFTHLEYQSGEQKLKTDLEPGKVMKIKVSPSKPFSIHSTERIQAFLYGSAGSFQGKPYGSFLTKIPDIGSFAHNYKLIGWKGFENNVAVIVAKASSVSGFLFNGKSLQNAEWKPFPDSEYVWSEISYGEGFSSNEINNPQSPFGVLMFGQSKNKAYGTVAPEIQAPEIPLPKPMGIGKGAGLKRKRRGA